ncbi:MAG: hypothetical protein P8X74_14855 [Reinekea sp.]
MGLSSLNPNLFAFSFDGGEKVILDNRGNSLAVSLITHWPEYELNRVMENVLPLMAYQATPEYQIQLGLKGDNCLAMTVFLHAREISLPLLDGCINALYRLSQQVQDATRGRI